MADLCLQCCHWKRVGGLQAPQHSVLTPYKQLIAERCTLQACKEYLSSQGNPKTRMPLCCETHVTLSATLLGLDPPWP
jgi:hypothetical protein